MCREYKDLTIDTFIVHLHKALVEIKVLHASVKEIIEPEGEMHHLLEIGNGLIISTFWRNLI